MAVAGVLLAALVSMGGCYDYGLGNLVNYTGGWDTGGTYWPDTSLYDPTADIQSVIDYRQDVYDTANDGWDDYIQQ